MKEFNPLEKPSETEIKKSLNQKILRDAFDPNDLDAPQITSNEGSLKEIDSQNTELEAMFSSKIEGQVSIARKIKEKINELDIKIKNFKFKAFENELDSLNRLHKLTKEIKEQKQKLRNILGGN